MTKEKKHKFVTAFDGKRAIVTAILILFSVGFVGGVVYYVMDKNASETKEATDKSIEELNELVDTYKSEIQKHEDEEAEAEAESTETVETSIEDLKAFCATQTAASSIVNPVMIVSNTNGTFGNCGISDGSGTGGGFMILKLVNNTWAKLWEGNGTIADSLCNEHKIPNSVSGGVCKF